jgi:hypothetical protein
MIQRIEQKVGAAIEKSPLLNNFKENQKFIRIFGDQ